MSSKRAAEDSDHATNFRARKKQKLTEARQIAVQSQNASSGHSTVRLGPVIHDSMKDLPGAIDVVKFAESRSYEINAMQNAMKSAGASSTHRAWQVLPRHLRRRAASHDPRRVPLRLRAKAKAEMDPVKKKSLGQFKPKLGRFKCLTKYQAFANRQRDKRWLETHIWHAKRMKMEDVWGYRLAITPTEKSFRPSHRASRHGAILHDASYQSLIELKGPEEILQSIFDMVRDCKSASPCNKRFPRYAGGSRALDLDFYAPGLYPFKLVGPVTIIWRPPPRASNDNNEKGKGKSQGELDKTAWIFCHPGMFDDIFSALRTATSTALSLTSGMEVELADLRGQLNAFELMGPNCSQVLKGALTPAMDGEGKEFKEFWDYLDTLQTPGSLPRNMVVGFKVYDPRLKFPPKNSKAQYTSSPSSSFKFTYPTSALARSELWHEPTRMKLKRPRFKKKDLDERRAKNLIPGTPLSALRQDDRVPLILIQRSLENSEQDTEAVHGFTLLLPAGWGMAFLSSLTHTGTRVGGQRERAHQAFEGGRPYFPRDFPGTALYAAHSRGKEEEEKAKWDRTPPAKRVNFEKLGTRSPWRADWEVVLELNSKDGRKGKEVLVSTQRGPAAELGLESNNMDVDENTEVLYDIPPWILRGKDYLETIVNNPNGDRGDPALVLHSAVENSRKHCHLDSLPPEITPEILLNSALITVKLKPSGRGAPADLAVIHSVNEEEVKELLHPRHKENANLVNTTSTSNSSPDSVIGYVTTGGFSLSRGEGFAIGSISLHKYIEMKRREDRLFKDGNPNTGNKQSRMSIKVKVRERDGQEWRLATIIPLH
ncbi:POP1-domain-containing protein [Marasmius fiardii PR-910]|nr:POP1-domain-containing protein [Marasmius fiardii PR-910]